MLRRFVCHSSVFSRKSSNLRFFSPLTVKCTVSTPNVPSSSGKNFRIPRNLRREGVNNASSVPTTSSSSHAWKYFAAVAATGAVTYYYREQAGHYAGLLYKATHLNEVVKHLHDPLDDMVQKFAQPAREKLLPDWPMPALGLPPDTRCPPTLVLDLEDTLIHSEWDRKFGWRHAKRPGVDKFLETLSRRYEIVIFSNQPQGTTEPIMALLDKKGCALHYLYRDSTYFTNETHVKDISKLNRDPKRIIIIDDDPAAYQLQPRNAIPVSPYLDGKERVDTDLTDLIPLLTAIAAEDIHDIPALLDEFRDSDGSLTDLPAKYDAKRRQLQAEREKKMQKGLGGMMYGRSPRNNTNRFQPPSGL